MIKKRRKEFLARKVTNVHRSKRESSTETREKSFKSQDNIMPPVSTNHSRAFEMRKRKTLCKQQF